MCSEDIVFKIHLAVMHTASTQEKGNLTASFVNLRKLKKVSYIATDDSHLTFVVCLLAICQLD